jgi:putative membrane protein
MSPGSPSRCTCWSSSSPSPFAVLWPPVFDWSFEPVPIIGTAAAASLYMFGRLKASTALGRGTAWDRGDLAFTAGLAALLLALVSPISSFDVTLQWVHMLQHVLLLIVAPPLILLGDPFRTARAGYLAMRGRPIDIAEKWPERAMRVLHSGKWAATLVVLAFSANLLIWHLPFLYNATLQNDAVHDLEHTTFLVLGLLFWDQVIGPVGVAGRLSVMGRATVVLCGMFVSWALAIVIGYASHPLYAYPAPSGGLGLLSDQEIAAGVMWVPGSTPFLVALLYLGVIWFELADRAATGIATSSR